MHLRYFIVYVKGHNNFLKSYFQGNSRVAESFFSYIKPQFGLMTFSKL